MTPLPGARQSFVGELHTTLTRKQNNTLYDMLAEATLTTIRHREYLMDLGYDGPEHEAMSGITNELLALRGDVTDAQYGVS